MKEELTNRLKELNFKNARIEKDLELPKNSLSAVLNGHKKMPDKWIEKVKIYLTRHEVQELSEAVVYPMTSAECFDSPKMTTVQDEPLSFARPLLWVQPINEFCEKEGIDPLDLIKWYKSPDLAPIPPKREAYQFPEKWGEMGRIDRMKWLTAHPIK
jgi:hypothetical protein